MKRSHQVRIYAPPPTDSDPYHPAPAVWTPRGAAVAATLQPLTGSVEQTAAGRQVRATWKGFLPAGTVVREDDGVVVLSGVGPSAYRIRQVGERGAPWDTEVLLEATAEEIGE